VRASPGVRARLVGYFDIGESYGLDDDAFLAKEQTPEPDLAQVGINFPLGHGVVIDVLETEPDLIERWRAAAVKQPPRLNPDWGWSAELGVPAARFESELAALVESHPIAFCELRIHAVGTVYAELGFDSGMGIDHLDGVLRCFEFAAYTPAIADPLLEAAQRRVVSALRPTWTGLVKLSQRELPEAKPDTTGYVERLLFSSFSQVIECVDEGDEGVAALLNDGRPTIEFPVQGKLHYGWSTCILEPEPAAADPEDSIARMLACIRVAHVFLGTCEAFGRLLDSEMREQVGGYAKQTPGGRPPEELNRLRTLALAVVNLTEFHAVTPSAEDQEYFERFAENGRLERKRRSIRDAAEVLYSVQAAEEQHEGAKRQDVLNVIALLLASLTLLSVGALGYDFVRAGEPLIDERGDRVRLLVEFTLGVGILFALLVIGTRRRRGR
jgi:hypothetical protein